MVLFPLGKMLLTVEVRIVRLKLWGNFVFSADSLWCYGISYCNGSTRCCENDLYRHAIKTFPGDIIMISYNNKNITWIKTKARGRNRAVDSDFLLTLCIIGRAKYRKYMKRKIVHVWTDECCICFKQYSGREKSALRHLL